MGRMNGLMMVGVILVVAGVLGFAIPVFTTQQTKEVARIGDLKLQNTEDTSHRIPPILSGGALVLGIVLIGASLYQKR
jgi:ABC-type nickel/cobalt efflux system permease component RcnA